LSAAPYWAQRQRRSSLLQILDVDAARQAATARQQLGRVRESHGRAAAQLDEEARGGAGGLGVESVLCCRGPGATSNCTGTSTGGPFVYRGTVSFDGVNFDCGNLPVCPRPTEPPVPAGVPFPHAGTGCTVPASTRCPVSVLSPDVSTATLGDTSACCYAGFSSATCSIINGIVSGSYTCGATTVPCDKIPFCTSRAPATPTVSPSAGAGLAPAVLAVLGTALLALL
jgi:hypothetical protein